MKTLFGNPVLVKELKLRFRNLKSFTGILFYLIAMSVFVFGFIFLATSLTGNGFFRPDESFMLFSIMTYIQLGLILFITPALTAGTISTEREKQTLNILLTTSQTSFQIIFGKMTSSIAFLLLMIVSGLPIYSLVFLYGGVSPSQLFYIFLFYMLTLLAIASIGVMLSTLIRKTIVAIIATYGAMIFIAGVTAFFLLISVQVSQMGSAVSSISPMAHFWATINPPAVLLTLLQPSMEEQLQSLTMVPIPLWIGYAIFYVLVSAGCLLLAVKKLRVNMNKYK
ncbi:ABC transporter permease [Planococcus kocurii]|uniref:ABC transporter permease n=2 Tax=Planococcus TaxID=1372 RepID=A0ABM5WUZ8_9BACL|nr:MULTISPECIES: ABC transporter permease [Planococcus]ALS78130.1 ABC transporter permease [Planococcus kocurii]AQU79967.1 ABC transporter permease [Planococcus faecalis]KAA0958479.1 ABC transporter permease [Planococcus sp. ANT_H30]OHX53613.1 ABC transporter permease [Planococcus faecalis]